MFYHKTGGNASTECSRKVWPLTSLFIAALTLFLALLYGLLLALFYLY